MNKSKQINQSISSEEARAYALKKAPQQIAKVNRLIIETMRDLNGDMNLQTILKP
jgi:hypothetical protein